MIFNPPKGVHEMKTQMKRGVLVLIALIMVPVMGLGVVSAVTQTSMDEMMDMMRQKMMNRPAAMMDADNAVQAQKAAAMQAGTYNCCLKNSCDYCALKMGECPCGMNAANDMPVCNECKGAWYAGDGQIPGKTADQIKTMPRGM